MTWEPKLSKAEKRRDLCVVDGVGRMRLQLVSQDCYEPKIQGSLLEIGASHAFPLIVGSNNLNATNQKWRSATKHGGIDIINRNWGSPLCDR
jgi:nucleoside-triphosphatase THEP1